MENNNELMTAMEISKILRISKVTTYDLMEAEGFPLIRLGRNKRVRRDSFYKWLENLEETS